jgi:tetratricopeptide (TPR) repeat protein
LLAVTAITYRGVIANGFVYDDAFTVVKNPAVRSLTRVPEWFVSPYAVSANRGGTNYRPVVVASYGLDYALWGEHGAGFHATNLAIHLAVVILVYLLALRLWSADVPAGVAAAWMALHPINAEAVNYITARSSTLAASFVLAALLCYDRWAGGARPERRSSLWLAGALGCGLLALGAKESAAVLPLLILIWDRARFGDSAPWGVSAARSLPFAGLLVGWLVLRQMVVGGTAAGDLPSMWLVQGLGFAAKIVNTSVGHSVWPAGLAVDYGWPPELDTATVVVAIAGSAGLVIAALGLTRVDRRMVWCAAWFGASLLPALLLPFITRIGLYQEHRAYLAEVGAAWLSGGAVWWVASKVTLRPWARLAAVNVLVVLAAAAIWIDAGRTRVWGDTVRLWQDALAKYPDSAVAHGERGAWLLNEGRVDAAERDFLAAIKTMPNYAYPYLMLGLTYAKRGEPTRAVPAYQTALEIRPRFVEARIRLGLAYEDLNLVDRALVEYDRAIEDDPWASPALVFSAAILDRSGRTDEAIERLRRVAADDPIYDDAQLRLGALLLKLERWSDARATLAALLARRPESAEARYFLDVATAEGHTRDAARGGES